VKKETFLKDSVVVFGSRVAILLINLIRSVVVARALGPVGRGMVSLAFMVPTLAVLLAKLDISTANVYFIGRRRFRLEQVIANSILFALLNGTFFVVLLFLLFPWLNRTLLQDLESPILFYVSILTIPCSLLSSYLLSTIKGLRQFVGHSLAGILMPGAGVVFLLVASFLGQLTELQVIAFRLAAIIIQVIALLLWLARRKALHFTLRFDRVWLRVTTNFSMRNYVGSLSQYLNKRLDLYLVAFLLGPEDIGYYVVAVALTEHFLQIPIALSIVLLPNVASAESQEANRFTPIVSRLAVTAVSVAVAVFWLILDILVPLVYTDKFEPSILPLRLLLPGAVSLTLWDILTNDLVGRGRPEYKSLSTGVALAITLVLNAFLTPLYGIAGAAIASTLAYTAAATVGFLLYRRVTGARLADVLIIRRSDLHLLYRATLSLRQRLSHRIAEVF